MHQHLLLHGSPKPLQEPVHLRAGELDMIYEAGFLRYIMVGEAEVLRMINHYIRDHNWTTIPMTITEEKIETETTSFSILYKAKCLQDDIQFQWTCCIKGRSDSTITFEIEGEALHSFRRNRLGFTVLHPLGTCSGRECIIIHSDKRKEPLKFPDLISPSQPFFDVTGMKWNPTADIEAALSFEGDVFETEDQRNWMDASYKTYCTPLSKPIPALVEKGEIIKQRVQLKVEIGSVPQHVAPREQLEKKKLTFTIDKQNTTTFPRIGLPLSRLKHDKQTLQRIKNLDIDFLRIELISSASDVPSQIIPALESGLPLELVIFFENELNPEFVLNLLPFKENIKQFIVLPAYANCTDDTLIETVVPLLRQHFPQCRIGGGTDAFFTELNRKRTPASSLDFLSFSVNPQVHAFDIATMTENLIALPDVVASCRAFADGKAIHVGPITLKKRGKPNTMAMGEEKPAIGVFPGDIDSRQLSLFGAAWTLGSFKYLAENNVSSISYYETYGWKGLMTNPEQPWPEDYLVQQDSVYPLYIVLKQILQNKHSRVAKLTSNNPLFFDGLAFVGPDETVTVLLVNFTRYDQAVNLPSDFSYTKSFSMAVANVEDLMMKPESMEYLASTDMDRVLLPPFSFTVLR